MAVLCMPDRRTYRVDVRFSAWGLHGRELVDVKAWSAGMARALGGAEIEGALIEAGARARECGCCALPASEGGDLLALTAAVVEW